jgi:hypothetical protein
MRQESLTYSGFVEIEFLGAAIPVRYEDCYDTTA